MPMASRASRLAKCANDQQGLVAHAVHHERGSHAHNYCDLPFIDMAFGTYKNPETFEGVGGFYDGASSRVVDMLLGRDVSEPVAMQTDVGPQALRSAPRAPKSPTPVEQTFSA